MIEKFKKPIQIEKLYSRDYLNSSEETRAFLAKATSQLLEDLFQTFYKIYPLLSDGESWFGDADFYAEKLANGIYVKSICSSWSFLIGYAEEAWEWDLSKETTKHFFVYAVDDSAEKEELDAIQELREICKNKISYKNIGNAEMLISHGFEADFSAIITKRPEFDIFFFTGPSISFAIPILFHLNEIYNELIK